MVIETLDDLVLGTTLNRTRTPAWGMAGGEPGAPGRMDLAQPGSRRWAKLGAVSGMKIKSGTRIRMRTPGGGGWGIPADKPPTQIVNTASDE